MQKFASYKDLNQKSDIKFIRVGAPKPKQTPQIKSYNHLPPSSSQQHFFLLIQLEYKNKPIESYQFPYNQSTKVSMLITFLKYKLKKQNIFFKSNSLHLDYFLTLEQRLVSELNSSTLKLTVQDISITSKGSHKSILNESKFYFQNSQINLSSLEIIKCIGCGGFSKVFLGRLYGKMLAVKVVDKQFIISTNKETIIENERLILEICSGHPFITKLYAAFQTNNFVIFVMEYCNGGQLFNLLRKVKKMKENDAKFYFLETLAAIEFLHSKGILYRDLKPENIMLDDEGHVRLADFGLSKVIDNGLTYSFCGSAEYMSPEMLLKNGHGYEVDYYCIGALLYELITGLPPFYTTDQAKLFDNILNQPLSFPSHAKISDDLKDFFQKILQKDSNKRFRNIKQIMSHRWVFKNFKKQQLYAKKLKPPYQTDVFIYNFDDGEFAHEEKQIMKSIELQKSQKLKSPLFPNLYYESKQIETIKKKIQNQQARTHFFKKKQLVRASSITPSQQIFTRSREDSIKSVNSRNSKTNFYYFPTRKESFDNIVSESQLFNAKSTPSLNRYMIKNDRDLDRLRKQSLNNSISQKNSIDLNGSLNSGYSQNIYTSKAGYYPNRNSGKVNHYYFNRFLNNQIYQNNNPKRNTQTHSQLASMLLKSGLGPQNYQSLQKPIKSKKLSVSLSKSLNKNTYFLDKFSPQNSNYSNKLKANDQSISKKYFDNYKGKLNISKIKKSGISIADKTNFYNGNRQLRR